MAGGNVWVDVTESMRCVVSSPAKALEAETELGRRPTRYDYEECQKNLRWRLSR
jgi:hypothetical protein